MQSTTLCMTCSHAGSAAQHGRFSSSLLLQASNAAVTLNVESTWLIACPHNPAHTARLLSVLCVCHFLVGCFQASSPAVGSSRLEVQLSSVQAPASTDSDSRSRGVTQRGHITGSQNTAVQAEAGSQSRHEMNLLCGRSGAEPAPLER